jgi:hypothetical protein
MLGRAPPSRSAVPCRALSAASAVRARGSQVRANLRALTFFFSCFASTPPCCFCALSAKYFVKEGELMTRPYRFALTRLARGTALFGQLH